MKKFLVANLFFCMSGALYAMHRPPTVSFSSFFYSGKKFPGEVIIVSPSDGGKKYTGYYTEGRVETIVVSRGPLNPCKANATRYFGEYEDSFKYFPDGQRAVADSRVVKMLHIKIEAQRLIDNTPKAQAAR